jgi:cation transport protein ChaC
LELVRWRGTPELPGLMMALAAGGRCNGMIQRVPQGEEAPAIHKLVLREISVAEDIGMARWIRVRDQESTKTALVFWAGPKGLGIVHGLPLEVVAWRLAHACGHYGSSAEYLYNTVVKLEEHGIRDRNLWRLQEMVADIVRAWPTS